MPVLSPQGSTARSTAMPGRQRVKDLDEKHVRQLVAELVPLASEKMAHSIEGKRVLVQVLNASQFALTLQGNHQRAGGSAMRATSALMHRTPVAYCAASRTLSVSRSHAKDMSWDKLRSHLFRALVEVGTQQKYPMFFNAIHDPKVRAIASRNKAALGGASATALLDVLNADSPAAPRRRASVEGRLTLVEGYADHLQRSVNGEFPAQRSFGRLSALFHGMFGHLDGQVRAKASRQARGRRMFQGVENGTISAAFPHNAFEMPVLADRYLDTAQHVNDLPHSAVAGEPARPPLTRAKTDRSVTFHPTPSYF